MKGFKKDGKFRPTEKKSKSSLSKKDMRYKKTVEKESKGIKEKGIGKLDAKTRMLAEEEVGSKITKHMWDDGNMYEFENGEEWLIVKNEEEARKEAIIYMENLFDDIGITGWNKSFASSYADEDLVDIAFEQVEKNNDYKLSRSDKVFDSPESKMEMFNDSLDADGIGHTLSSYDGSEVELDNGALMYRHN